MKKISILGSTGSIGTQALDVIAHNQDKFKVTALSCAKSLSLLCRQIEEFSPEAVAVRDEADAKELADKYKDLEVFWGAEGLKTIASMESCDMVLNSLMGMKGLEPTMAAIESGKDIAFANKETLVAGGQLVMDAVKKHGVAMLPVDSEHSAIFQSLQGNVHGDVEKILLTASGGPFRGKDTAFLENVQVEDALKHPNWSMGRKITIDSATMVNKGLEVIEAKWLFDVKPENIQVVVQPQSIIHSMVEYRDGAVIAQLGTPDMKLPIQYALCYPERRYMAGDRLNFWTMNSILLEKPDMDTFKGLKYAYSAIADGGSMPTVFNAANEFAVAKFLGKKISYLEITDMIEAAMEHHKKIAHPSLEEVLGAESETYEFLKKQWNF